MYSLSLLMSLSLSANHTLCSKQASSDDDTLVTLELPEALSPRVMNALKADPRTVDIRSLAPHFYNLGARMLETDEDAEMVDVMSEVRFSC